MDATMVRYDVADRVATITLNRPEVMNAMTVESAAQLLAAFDEAERDPAVGCAVVTGAGKAFCAGDDVQSAWEPEALEPELAKLRRSIPAPTTESLRIVEFEKPLIAAVNGIAVGWGLDLALLADIRLANPYARFGALYVNFNLCADFGSLRRLPQLVGPSRAAEILFTGDLVDAAEAERIGLVSRVVEADALMDEARALAGRIAAKPLAALRALKAGLRLGTGMTAGALGELGAFVGRSLTTLFETDDHHEAVKAFMEGRAPVFTGR